MSDLFRFSAIGYARSPFREKFGAPRQAGLAPSIASTIEILPEYSRVDAFAELTGVSHIWLQFVFHQQRGPWKPRVKAPRLGGNRTAGVFATRSPNRPNPIGLSAVILERFELVSGAMHLFVRGADLVDGTPILDVKPYLPYADCHSNAVNAFSPTAPESLPVTFSAAARDAPKSLTCEIAEFLRYNPAPAYHSHDSDRVYRCHYRELTIVWQRTANTIVVTAIEPLMADG